MSTALDPVGTVPRTISVAAPPPARHEGYGRGFWGVAILIATEGMLFLALVATYFFLRAASTSWPLGGIEPPEIGVRAWVFTALLLGSSVPIFWADAAVKQGDYRVVRVALTISSLMGAAFLVNTVLDFRDLTFGWDTNAYGSIYYVIVGLHATHVGAGLVISAVVQIKLWMGLIDAEHHTAVEVFSLYWHFVDAVWIVVFASVFISPHLR
ncbi:MAG TPA: cytochrome c oxidase subunit 3 [Acidimicrobiia bacterium]